jgi:hypothetical protein
MADETYVGRRGRVYSGNPKYENLINCNSLRTNRIAIKFSALTDFAPVAVGLATRLFSMHPRGHRLGT